MPHFTTDFQIVRAAAAIRRNLPVHPAAEPILSILPGKFAISFDTARLIGTLTYTAPPLALAA